jgi:hypothetical protein
MMHGLSALVFNAQSASLGAARRTIKLPRGDKLESVRVDYSTSVVICSQLASLGLAGTHPTDLRPASADPKRWPHLPRYNDFVAYVKRKAQGSLRDWVLNVPEMLTSSRSRNIFIAAEQWSTVEPGVVDKRAYYQHPSLRAKATGKRNVAMHCMVSGVSGVSAWCVR